MAKQFKSSLFDECGDRWLHCSSCADFSVADIHGRKSRGGDGERVSPEFGVVRRTLMQLVPQILSCFKKQQNACITIQ